MTNIFYRFPFIYTGAPLQILFHLDQKIYSDIKITFCRFSFDLSPLDVLFFLDIFNVDTFIISLTFYLIVFVA